MYLKASVFNQLNLFSDVKVDESWNFFSKVNNIMNNFREALLEDLPAGVAT